METHSFIRAPHGLRALAWTVDCLVVAVVFAAVPQPTPLMLLVLLFVAYHGILLGLTQQTVGKALVGLRVRRIGRKPGVLWALGRSSFGYFAVDLLGTGLRLALFDRQHRTLHDVIFGSLVTVDATGRLTARNLLARFVAFCERQAEAIKARKKTLGIVGAFWGFLLGLGRALKSGVDNVTRVFRSWRRRATLDASHGIECQGCDGSHRRGDRFDRRSVRRSTVKPLTTRKAEPGTGRRLRLFSATSFTCTNVIFYSSSKSTASRARTSRTTSRDPRCRASVNSTDEPGA